MLEPKLLAGESCGIVPSVSSGNSLAAKGLAAIVNHCHAPSRALCCPLLVLFLYASAQADGRKCPIFHPGVICGREFLLDPVSPHSFSVSHEQRTLNSPRTEYEYLEQGSAVFRREAVLPEGTVPSRASFSQGDACSLDVEALGSFDAVLASNLLCRCVPQV